MKSHIASSALFLSLRDPVCFCCSCCGITHTVPRGSILGTDFPAGHIGVKTCEGLLKGVLEASLFPTLNITTQILTLTHSGPSLTRYNYVRAARHRLKQEIAGACRPYYRIKKTPCPYIKKTAPLKIKSG